MNGRARSGATTLLLAAAVTVLAACATTTVDQADPNDPAAELSDAELTGGEGRELAEDDTSPLDSGVIVDADEPAVTVPIEGSAADLLPEIAVGMSRLSGEIAGDGDEDATMSQIEGLWAAVIDEVESTRPELVGGIQVTIDMARTAVDRNRPADGDKAFGLLNDFVDEYTGDA